MGGHPAFAKQMQGSQVHLFLRINPLSEEVPSGWIMDSNRLLAVPAYWDE